MSWKDTLKMHCNSGEKMGCDCAKCREKTNKALSSKQKKLERFIYFSTDEVFGPAPKGVNYKERDRYNSTNQY